MVKLTCTWEEGGIVAQVIEKLRRIWCTAEGATERGAEEFYSHDVLPNLTNRRKCLEFEVDPEVLIDLQRLLPQPLRGQVLSAAGADLLALAVERWGTQRRAAEALMMNQGYISQVLRGEGTLEPRSALLVAAQLSDRLAMS